MTETHVSYYEVLGLEATANREQIAQAFCRLAPKYHPLRNDQAEQAHYLLKFSEVCEAYEVLSNETTKNIYDKYGDYSLKNGIPEGPEQYMGYLFGGKPYKIFESFFGSANPYIAALHKDDEELSELQKISQDSRAEDIVVTVECQLHEFFCGALKDINYPRKKMYAATEGSSIKNEWITVEVRPGFGEHTTIRYPGRGHEAFGSDPSDLIIKFKQVQKDGYVRDGDDIVYTHTLSLVEALEAQPIKVWTLDSRTVLVTPNMGVTPQTELRVAGEGMPCQETGDIVVDTQTVLKTKGEQPRGDLRVRFNIIFPTKILAHHRQSLLDALELNTQVTA